MHGIPKSTLHDRISGNVTHGDKPGPDQLLSPAEEEELSNFLVEVAQAGYAMLLPLRVAASVCKCAYVSVIVCNVAASKYQHSYSIICCCDYGNTAATVCYR